MSVQVGTTIHRNRCSHSSTRTSTWSKSEGSRQLDWFCTRGLKVRDPAMVPSLGDDASVLSDHELTLVTVLGLSSS